LNVRDITERKKIEDELIESKAHLKEANDSKDRFLTIIGHDLKSPFNTIIGFSQILLSKIEKEDNNGLGKYANIICDASRRALLLLNNLLEWSKTQTKRTAFHPEHFELKTVIDDVVELSNSASQQKSITISKNVHDTMLVFADVEILKAILRNLISNAIKYTNQEGEIVISAEQYSNELVVSVADNGVGISKKNMDNLFNIDYNCSTQGTNKEKGTGLGLLLCREFIEMHGGKIRVENNDTGGSTFYFSLPDAISNQ